MSHSERIAKNLYTVVKAEIVIALNHYYPINDPIAMEVKGKVMLQKWSDLPPNQKQYFRDKAFLIITK